MEIQSAYNSYWDTWHESERVFYKNLKPTQSELQQKDLQSRLSKANNLKDQGNLFFKQQLYTEAAKLYLSAIEQAPESLFASTLHQEYSQLKLAIMSNLSMCFLKNKQYHLAIIQTKEGLKQFPLNVKLRYILGTALGETEELEASIQVLKDARDLDPANREVREKLETYSKQFTEYKKKMREMFGGKLKQAEKIEPRVLAPEPESKEEKIEIKPENPSIIPKILLGAGILTLGFFIGKKFLSRS